MVSIASHGVEREGYVRSNLASGDASEMVTSKQGLMGVKCNQTISSPQKASSMARLRTREANTGLNQLKEARTDMKMR